MSDRLIKINALLREEIGQILRDELDFDSGVLVTITRAQVSPTLEHANVFISTLPKGRESKTLQQINSQIYNFQKILNKRLVLRTVPKIRFVVDDSTIHADRINALLQKAAK